MADVKISALPASTTPLAGTEVLPIVQSGVTKKTSIESVLTSVQPSGTANGVAYLNGSKVLTTGSALTFDGTNLGLAVAPSAWGSSFRAFQIARSSFWTTASGGSTYIDTNAFYDNVGYKYIANGFATEYAQVSDGSHRWFTAPSGTAGNAITFTQAMTLNAIGDLLVGLTTTSYSAKLAVSGGIFTRSNQFNIEHSTSSSSNFEFVLRTGAGLDFYVNNAAVLASLSSSGVWTNASDARYKENIRPVSYGLAEVMQLQPRAYNLIGSDKQEIGFVAQEVQPLIPELVESATNSVTGEDRLTLSYGQLSAVLVKAIQELKAEFDAYKASHP